MFCIVVPFVSCERHDQVNLPDCLEYVYDKNGRVNNYSIDLAKKRVIQYQSLNMLHDDLFHTPRGKLNKIIADNPDWEFVFFCHCDLCDTTDLIKTLQRYDTDHRVIIDTAACFLSVNQLSEQWTELGFICDKKGKCYGIGIAGSSLSSFDSYFAQVKRKLL